jgi:hypothetical protein
MDEGEKEPSYTAGGNVTKYNLFGKHYRGSLKTKTRPAKDLGIALLGIYPRECESTYNKTPACPLLLQHYSQYLSFGKCQHAPLLN